MRRLTLSRPPVPSIWGWAAASARPRAVAWLLLALGVVALGGAVPASTAVAAEHAHVAPKYYFELRGVEASANVPMDGGTRAFVEEALRQELASRSEWASDVGATGGATKNRQALFSELERRKLSGFELVVKLTSLKKEAKPPEGGGRLKHLVVSVRLALLGTTLPGEKIAFGGDGEASYETDVPESRVEPEAEALSKDAIREALKQAVDQAVLKLALPKSEPLNESKKRRKRS